MKVCNITDSQNRDFPNRKQEWQTPVGMWFLVHISAQLSANNRKEQFTSSSFINVILYVEIKTTVNLSS
jgi:hypothetical protein